MHNTINLPITIVLGLVAAVLLAFATEASAARYAATPPKPDRLMMLRVFDAYNHTTGPMCSRAVVGLITHLTKDKRAWLRSRASREFKRTYRAARGKSTDERNCNWLNDPYNWRSFKGIAHVFEVSRRQQFFADVARALRIAKCRLLDVALLRYAKAPLKLYRAVLRRATDSRCW